MLCDICGNEISFEYDEQYNALLKKNHLCFDCHFWSEKIKNYGMAKGQFFVVGKNCYMMSRDDSSGMKGFGGQKFRVLFGNGDIVVTKNLWTQGEIPERFRDMLRPNAIFLRSKTDMTWMTDSIMMD